MLVLRGPRRSRRSGAGSGEIAVFKNVRRAASVRAHTVEHLSMGQAESVALSVLRPIGEAVSGMRGAAAIPAAAADIGAAPTTRHVDGDIAPG